MLCLGLGVWAVDLEGQAAWRSIWPTYSVEGAAWAVWVEWVAWVEWAEWAEDSQEVWEVWEAWEAGKGEVVVHLPASTLVKEEALRPHSTSHSIKKEPGLEVRPGICTITHARQEKKLPFKMDNIALKRYAAT